LPWPFATSNLKMYEFLSGKIVHKDPARVILEVGGIGFELVVPLSTFQALGKVGEQARVLTHFLVREDSHQLYGFATDEERSVFRLLLSVSGVGPKTALTTLSGIGTAELRKAIVDGALPVLTAISGIGRKTAERLIVELREKILLLGPKSDVTLSARVSLDEQLVEDSIQALVSLGYRRLDAKRALQKVLTEKARDSYSVEDLIRVSLKYI